MLKGLSLGSLALGAGGLGLGAGCIVDDDELATAASALTAFPIGAALSGPAAAGSPFHGKGYFFVGGRYRRYDWATDTLDDGGSLPIAVWHLPPSWRAGIDAAVNGHGDHAHLAYLFRGGEFVTYDWEKNQLVGAPRDTAGAWSVDAAVAVSPDAVLEGVGAFAGKTYFFRGDRYVRYDWATNRQDYASTLAAWNLPPAFATGIDAAINGQGAYAGKAYFFKGDQYVRYDWASGGIDPGYPRAIADAWPALLGLADPPRRRLVLYVTIEPDKHWRHGNVDGLQRLASQWRSTTYVHDLWCSDVDDALLADPHLLAVFGSGSFAEWVGYFTDAAWRARLDAWCARIRAMRAPMFAVCGTHQLVAYAHGGWGAVGHMPPPGAGPIPIALEADGVSRIPDPRIREAGDYAMKAYATDPILAGLPASPVFFESHGDEVLHPAPGGAVRLLGPDPADARPRSQVQALRYPRANGSLLYTTQFHPETPDDASEPASRRLLHNFFDLAAASWT